MYKFEAVEEYCEFLDEIYPGVSVAGSSFYASTVLKECDPIAFDIGLDEWIVQNVEEGNMTVQGYEEYEPEEDDDDE
jgi:hypothetical protein